jgi:hypothetical protein
MLQPSQLPEVKKHRELKQFPYGIVSPATIPDVADRILDEYFQITGRMGIKSCLALGLCLGIVRDGAYLGGDNDLDVIAVVNQQEQIVLTDTMIGNGYEQGLYFPEKNNAHFIKGRILVDVYFRTAAGFYAELGSVNYKGKTYPVPLQFDKYLTVCYSSWRIPSDQGAGDILAKGL